MCHLLSAPHSQARDTTTKVFSTLLSALALPSKDIWWNKYSPNNASEERSVRQEASSGGKRAFLFYLADDLHDKRLTNSTSGPHLSPVIGELPLLIYLALSSSSHTDSSKLLSQEDNCVRIIPMFTLKHWKLKKNRLVNDCDFSERRSRQIIPT